LEGWIKLHRKILDSRFGKNLELRGLFDSILLLANHREGFTVDGTKIMPGQFMTSQKDLAKQFKIERNRMRRLLEKLEEAGQIEQQTSAKNTIITVINWDAYQSDEQQVNIKRTSDEHQVNTNKNAKNVKNKKNDKKLLEASPLAFLFDATDSIQQWLLTGTEQSQKEILEKHSHHVLVEEIKKAYLWQLEKQPRKAGTFLVTWLSNKKTHAYGANKPKATLSVGVTPDNPTGNPYLFKTNLNANGEIA
jgi:DNA-binding Lrp family transcriptional regulator